MNIKEFTKNFGDVFLIDEDGTSLGHRTVEEAKSLATNKGLKLVEVDGKMKPPVVRMLDLGLLKYSEKKNKKPIKVTEIKTLQLTVGTAQYDIATKANKANVWLQEGNKVFIKVSLYSRQASNPSLGMEQIKDLLAKITTPYVEDIKCQASGNVVTMTIKPC